MDRKETRCNEDLEWSHLPCYWVVVILHLFSVIFCIVSCFVYWINWILSLRIGRFCDQRALHIYGFYRLYLSRKMMMMMVANQVTGPKREVVEGRIKTEVKKNKKKNRPVVRCRATFEVTDWRDGHWSVVSKWGRGGRVLVFRWTDLQRFCCYRSNRRTQFRNIWLERSLKLRVCRCTEKQQPRFTCEYLLSITYIAAKTSKNK